MQGCAGWGCTRPDADLWACALTGNSSQDGSRTGSPAASLRVMGRPLLGPSTLDPSGVLPATPLNPPNPPTRGESWASWEQKARLISANHWAGRLSPNLSAARPQPLVH